MENNKELNELKNEQLEAVTGGTGDLTPKYKPYTYVQFIYHCEDGRTVTCSGKIRSSGDYNGRIYYYVECSKYPDAPKGGGIISVYEEDITYAG